MQWNKYTVYSLVAMLVCGGLLYFAESFLGNYQIYILKAHFY